MENLIGSFSEEAKGISLLSGSSTGSSESAISNMQHSSISKMALPSFSNASSTPKELGSMTMEQLSPTLHESNLCERTLLHLRDASSCKHVTCNQKTCNIDVKELWDSPGIAFKLLEELISVYKKLDPLQITTSECNRICDVLALLQKMASHPEVKMGLIRAKIPYYVYPFLQTKADDKALAHIRLGSLGVLGALVKCDDPEQAQSAVYFLLETEVFPLCLGWMDKGTEHIQKVATLIVVKILMQEEGLKYCSFHAERFFAIVQVLTRIVDQLATKPCTQMLQYVVYCFVRLSEAARSSEVTESMRRSIPAKLRDDTFREIFQKNPEITRMLQQLLCNLTPGLGPNP